MEYKKITLDYNSLEPYIDDLTLNIHYNKHYEKYTNTLNKLLKEVNYKYNYSPEYLAQNIDIIPIDKRNDILYNLGGYLNHSLYFNNLTNKKTKVPEGLLKEINKYFNSFDNFKKELISLGVNLKGSGYTFLVLDNNKLRLINMSNQDTPYYYGFIPILGIDVWEHSYYLQYTYNREQYLNNIFNIIDYNKVYKLYLDNIK